MIEVMYMNDMDDRQRSMFLAEFSQKRKEVTAGVLLALFLGPYGGHRFYLGEKQLGIAYLCYTLVSFVCFFFLIGIPMLLLMQVVCVVECFMMPDRVRAYNNLQAGIIAAQVKGLTAAPTQSQEIAEPVVPTLEPRSSSMDQGATQVPAE